MRLSSPQASPPQRVSIGAAPRFGHQPKPPPENTSDWFKTFGHDLFYPEAPCTDPTHHHTPPALKDKNVFQKIALWFQELLGGLFKDFARLGSLLTQDPKAAQEEKAAAKHHAHH